MDRLRYLERAVTLQLDAERCVGCGLCEQVCPHGVFQVSDRRARLADRGRCMECGACARNCPVEAIRVAAGVGCASAIVYGWLTGSEPSCDCKGGIDSGGGCC